MERIDEPILDEFQRLTSYDISTFFSTYIEFNDQHYPDIINFYSSASIVVPTVAFERLAWLQKEKRKVVDLVILNESSLDNYQFWIVVEYIEEIGYALETANNSSKWLRAASTGEGYRQQVVTDYMTSQGQTLEDIERKVLQSNTSRDSWADTALENQLAEDDYNLEGGQLIKVVYKNNASLFLNSVVDNIDEPQKTFGLDIDRNITFEDDDLVVLGYEDTLKQSAQILSELKRNDDPAFPDRGVDHKSVLGGSLAAVSYPAIFRDLASNFATDDSFKSFSVTDVRREVDKIMLDFTVETKTGDFFSQSSQL